MDSATNDLSTVLKARMDAGTNDLSTVLKARMDSATNDLSTVLKSRMDSGTNDLNTALVTKIGNATNDLNSAIVLRITTATNDVATRTGNATNDLNTTLVARIATALVTNKVYWTNVVSLTNSQFQTVNMSIKEGDFETNAAFAFLGLTGKSTTNYQSAVITVHNTTGSAVGIVAPPNTTTNGTLPYLVTNYSMVLLTYHPVYNWTNMLVFPIK
jgi:hypothetical protein